MSLKQLNWPPRVTPGPVLLCPALLAFGALGCNAAIGLDNFHVHEQVVLAEQPARCRTNSDCDSGSDDDAGSSPAYCDSVAHKCRSLLSEDCETLTGDPYSEDVIFIGSLFSTEGPQAATNLARQRSAALAVEQVNAAGGIPAAEGHPPRQLVLLSCNETADVVRAAEHLADIGVSAIIGPNTSQDTLQVSREVTNPRGIAVVTPTGVASSIGDLVDDDLTFQMVATDVQRGPLMVQQIEAIAKDVASARESEPVKLGIIFRDDALGLGTRTSLNSLVLNGKPLAGADFGTTVDISGYDYTQGEQLEIVEKYVAFAPDVIALAGTAEAITQIMVPLEAAWTAAHRPQYVLIDSAKVPELLAATADNLDLRARIRGSGVKPAAASAATFDAFRLDYQIRYGETATTSGMGPAYDAAFSVALALAATRTEPVTGRAVSTGLRRLSGGPEVIELGAVRVLAAFQALASAGAITAVGTFAPLEWNPDGTVVESTLEMWCIGTNSSGAPAYKGSGLTFDIRTQTAAGAFEPCTPQSL